MIRTHGRDGTWHVYLAGEIHSDWRERIAEGVKAAGLPVELLAPVTDHGASDDVGVDMLGPEDERFWHDHKGAGINAVRTQTLIRRADVVVVRFGEKYKQWNAAFDAGYAAALGKPMVSLHPEEHDHALKELDRAAMATAESPSRSSRFSATRSTAETLSGLRHPASTKPVGVVRTGFGVSSPRVRAAPGWRAATRAPAGPRLLRVGAQR